MVTGTQTGRVEAADPEIHQGFPPASRAVEPLNPAPARFGVAGISAGQDRAYKRTLRGHAGLRRQKATDQVARGLGWFSLALGAAEVFAGRGIAKWLGVEDKTWLIRLFGVREIGNGVAILLQHSPRDRGGWTWVRVGGDALDLTALAAALRSDNPNRDNVVTAILAVGGVTALDVLCAAELTVDDWGGRGRHGASLLENSAR